MSNHAEKCPLCNGSGKSIVDISTLKEPKILEKICHGCDGKGWVTVEDKPKSETKLVTNAAQPEVADTK